MIALKLSKEGLLRSFKLTGNLQFLFILEEYNEGKLPSATSNKKRDEASPTGNMGRREASFPASV